MMVVVGFACVTITDLTVKVIDDEREFRRTIVDFHSAMRRGSKRKNGRTPQMPRARSLENQTKELVRQ
jgi:hypothetical protein